jgi:hypothetical protein
MKWLNELNRSYLLYLPEVNPKELDQDEIIEILDQFEHWNPEWHEAMVNANIAGSVEKSLAFLVLFRRN